MPTIKQKPDDLYVLIRSMNGNEKRYFKVLYGNTTDINNKGFVMLFDIISKQDMFDQQKLINEIKDKGLTTNLNKTKQYLFNAVIKSLFFYYVENDLDLRLRMDFLEIQILNKKNLSELLKKRVKILEKKAVKHQKHLLLNDIYFLLKSNLSNLGLKSFDDFDINKLKQKTSNTLNVLSAENQYRDLILDAKRVLENAKNQPAASTKKQFQKILSSDLLKDNNRPDSYQAILLYYTVKCFLLMHLGNRREALIVINNYLAYVKKHLSKSTQNNMHYLIGLGNKVGLLVELKEYKEIENILKVIKNINCENEYYELLKFKVYYINSFQFFLLTKQPEKILKLYPEISEQINQQKNLLSLDIIGYFEFAYAKTAFELGHIDRAVKSLQNLINNYNCTIIPQLYISVKIQLILCMYLLENYSVIEYLSQALILFLRKRKLTNSFEFQFLKLLKKLPLSDYKINQLKLLINDSFKENPANYYQYSNPAILYRK